MRVLFIIKLFFYVSFSLSALFGEDKKRLVSKSDIDSLNTLTKKSPERAIRYARELLGKKVLEKILNLNTGFTILGEIFGSANVRQGCLILPNLS